MSETLILGSEGYIGSALTHYLKGKITGIDILNGVDYCSLEKDYISSFKNIILLAGNSSVGSCNCEPHYSLNNNVVKFIKLIDKISTSQKLIYASSSSVYGNTNGAIATEESNTFIPINYYDLTKYTIDCYAKLSSVEYYGLRFGTVNGKTKNSSLVRDDIMINAMMKNGIINGEIKSINPMTNRPILGIIDLCRAVQTILDGNDNRGIYNLASFNTNVFEVSEYIASKYNIKIESILDNSQKVYDFMISSDKFKNKYNFNFNDTIDSITDSIYIDFKNIKFIGRKECLKI